MKPIKNSPQKLYGRVFQRVAALVVTALIITLGVSHAAKVNSDTLGVVQNYSIFGTISNISVADKTVTVINKGSSDKNANDELVFNLAFASKIESSSYAQLSFDDLNSADTVILQGIKDNDLIKITRVIDFSWNGVHATSTEASNTVASSTEVVSSGGGLETASSTLPITSDVATSTATTTVTVTVATSTDDSVISDTAASTTSVVTPISPVATSTDVSSPVVEVASPADTAMSSAQ